MGAIVGRDAYICREYVDELVKDWNSYACCQP